MFVFPLLFAALPMALLVLLLGRWHPGSPLIHLVGGSGPLLSASAGLWLAISCWKQGALTAYHQVVYVDALSALLLTVIALVSLLTIMYSIPYLSRDLAHGKILPAKLGWYYFWFNLLVAAMYATVVLNSLGLTWVLIEATTLVSVPLVGYYGTARSLEAAWKYLIIASVGISFALLGILLTYIASASHLGEQAASLDFTFLLSHAATLNPGLLKLAFLFILVGYGTKTGIAPMHTWLPDAHSQAPTPISALLSGALLNCALYGILRFTILTNAVLDASFTATLLQLFGLVSIGLVIPFLLKQDDIKRLLAYSSVEHMGIILLALGIGGKLGRIAAALHLFNHALTKSLLFCVAGEVTERYQTREIHKIRGVMQATPLLGILLFVGALAITGVPPFNIFVSELMVIAAAFAAHQYLVAALALLLLTTVFVCFFPHIATMAFGQGTRESPSSFSEGDLAREPQTETLVATTIQKPGGAEKIALVLFAIPALALLIGGFWQPWFLQDWLYMIGAAL